MSSLAIAALALMLAGGAQAGEIYKCPTPSGKIEFTDKPCATGAKVEVQPNSIGEGDLSAIREKKKALDDKIAARQKRDDDDARATAEHNAQAYQLCQGFRDQIAVQRPYLAYASPSVSASAAADIRIQRRKLAEYGCP